MNSIFYCFIFFFKVNFDTDRYYEWQSNVRQKCKMSHWGRLTRTSLAAVVGSENFGQ